VEQRFIEFKHFYYDHFTVVIASNFEFSYTKLTDPEANQFQHLSSEQGATFHVSNANCVPEITLELGAGSLKF
jgi:hypothetical protein